MDEIPDSSSNRRFHNEANGDPPSSESIEEQLARILKSETFAGSARLQAFLEFTVRQHLKGNAEALKEYSIALEVFRKPPTYDPSFDSTVRSAAVRLREKLKEYYAGEGRNDPLLIDLPGGHYIPRFTSRLPNPEQNCLSLELTAQETGDQEGKLRVPQSIGPEAGAPVQRYADEEQKRNPDLDGATRDVVGSDRVPTLSGKPATLERTTIRWGWRWFFAVLAAALLALAMFAYWRSPRTAPGYVARKSVAVLGFQNLSHSRDSAWLSPALVEMFRAELAAGDKLRIISGEETTRAKAEMDLREAGTLSKETLAHLGRNLGVDWVVVGSYVELGGASGEIRLDLQIQGTTGGETIATVSGNGVKDRLFDIVSRAGAELRVRLGVQAISPAESLGLRATLPANQAALRLYTEGIVKLRMFDALTARDLLTKAVVLDPSFSLSHSALAEAWSALGYDNNAKEQARKALDLSKDLPREERWLIEGRYREMTREWEKAIEAYKKLWAFHPDAVDHGLRLAAAQTSSGKGKDALATIEELRKLSRAEHTPERTDPQIELAEAVARGSLADYKQELAAAQHADQIGIEQRAWLVVARAKIEEGMAFWRLAKLTDALTAFDRARTLYSGVSDKRGLASALNAIANIASDQGDLVTTKKTYEDALALYREIGDKGGMATVLNDLGVLLKNRGDLRRARKRYDESLAICREIADRHGEARALFNMALLLWGGPPPGPLPLYQKALKIFEELSYKTGQNVVLNEMGVWSNNHGQLPQALDFFNQTLEISRQTGERGAVALAYWNQAEVLSNLGRLEESKRSGEQALAIYRELNLPSAVAQSHNNLGAVLYRTGDFGAARKEYEEAVRLLTSMGDKKAPSESQLGLALLDLEEGRPVAVESMVRNLAQQFHEQKATDGEMLGYLALSRCLLRQRKYKEAQAAIRQAATLEKSVGRKDLDLQAAILRARARAGLGDVTGARSALRRVLSETTKLGYRGLELEARCAATEIELRTGKSDAARRDLLALAEQSRAEGFGFVAGEAAAAAK
jgi:tetratricopeptide (TPR) repeat protein